MVGRVGHRNRQQGFRGRPEPAGGGGEEILCGQPRQEVKPARPDQMWKTGTEPKQGVARERFVPARFLSSTSRTIECGKQEPNQNKASHVKGLFRLVS